MSAWRAASLALGPMTPSPAPVPTDVAGVLAALQREPGRPRLTWYGPDHERVELSGAVLDNWVSKTGNLLLEELEAGPGTRVALDLPPHWRSVVWALAVWRTGACAVAGADEADVVVTDRPDAHPGARDLVAVALPALARRVDGTLPAGALDAAASVMTYGDVLGPTPAPDVAAPALDGAAGTVTAVAHRDLVASATRVLGDAAPAHDGAPARVVVPATGGLDHVLLRTLGVLAAGGSVVLLADAVAADPDRVARIASDERVDLHLSAPDAPAPDGPGAQPA